jgi:hypothetical protein
LFSPLALALPLYLKPIIMKNTRTLLLLAVFCLFALISLAQPSAGLKAGVNYTSLSGYSGDHRVAFHAGVYIQAPVNKTWSFCPELVYSAEGQHHIITGDGDGHAETKGLITVDLVTMPLLFRFTPRSKFYVEAGPQLSLVIAAHSKGLGTDDMNMKRSFSNGRFEFSLGAGMKITPKMAIYGRYNVGMNDMIPGNTEKNKTGVGQLGVSFRISKQRKVEVIPEK